MERRSAEKDRGRETRRKRERGGREAERLRGMRTSGSVSPSLLVMLPAFALRGGAHTMAEAGWGAHDGRGRVGLWIRVETRRRADRETGRDGVTVG